MYDTPNPPFPRGESKPLPPEPLPGMLEALKFNQAACLKALTEGEGRGLSTRQMALNLERESGYRDLYEALRQAMDCQHPACGFRLEFEPDMRCNLERGHAGDHFGMRTGQWVFSAQSALAKARGDKPDAT